MAVRTPEAQRGAVTVERGLTDFLVEDQARILDAWTDRVRGHFEAKGLSRSVLLDHLPQILATIIDGVRGVESAPPVALTLAANRHAQDRLARGFDLDEVILDYAILRRCILEQWEQKVGAMMRVFELKQLDAALEESITESVVRFAKARERMLVALDRISVAALGRQELDGFLHELTRVTREVSDVVDAVVVWLHEGGRLVVHAQSGVPARDAVGENHGHFASAVAAAAKPVYLRLGEPGSPPRPPEESIPADTRALYGIPLLHEGEVLGVVHMSSSSTLEFSEDDKLLFRTMANRATTILFQAQLMAARTRVELERDALLATAQQAVRTREDLLAIVSHDLRNPLSTVMLSGTQLLRTAAAGPEGDRQRKNASALLRAAHQMTRLVSDLLDLSQIDAGKSLPLERKSEDGAAVARHAAQAMEPLASARQHRLEARISDSGCELFCDADRIQQVLSELLGNAIKYTPPGGTLTVAVDRQGPEVTFSVTDTGIGMSSEQLGHVFDAYWQARANRKGVGLGLSVSKAIVEAHGGRIWVKSTLGAGSVFSFALPAGPQAPDGEKASS